MILSISRRTDIPNYYSDWFFNRLKAGFLYVRNPMNAHQISRVNLLPEVVDCIVFWTKNPKNMLSRLNELKDYKYYFQFTITGYGKDVEMGIPDKQKEIIPTFRELSERIGKNKVIWRYDPILVNDKYTVEYHLRAFEKIANSLSGYTEKVIISFVDLYLKTQRNTADLSIKNITKDEMMDIATKLFRIAQKYHLKIESCAEQVDLSKAGIQHGSCIDKRLIEEILGCKLKVNKDKNQRKECGCMESIEVGTYNTCLNGCKYCYANFNNKRVQENVILYDKNSPMLCGTIGSDDKITERKINSLKDSQISFLD